MIKAFSLKSKSAQNGITKALRLVFGQQLASPPLRSSEIDDSRRVTVTPFLHDLNDLSRGLHRILVGSDLKEFMTTKLMRKRFQKYSVRIH